MQRNGTTSVGDFYEEFGFARAGWFHTKKNDWSKKYFDGDYEAIFNSDDFVENIVFEDGPWSIGDFYKVLFHRFPKAKFVLITRDPDEWFDSMVSHSNGRTLGNTFRHSCVYNRETEYYDKIGGTHDYESNEVDNLLELNEEHRNHYVQYYIIRHRQLFDFFLSKNPSGSRLIHLDLKDESKWVKLAEFSGFMVPNDYRIHSNKSDK